MKKTLLLLSLACLLCGKTSAQTNDSPYAAFSFGLLTPLSTNGARAGEYTNGASVNLLAGNSRNEEHLVVSGLCSIISERATGLQVAGISTYIGREGRGVALSGVANITRESYKGVQLSGVMNRSGAHSRGVLIGGLYNRTKDHFSGLQFSGLLNIAKDIKGLQFAGLVNVAEEVQGVQFAVLVNVAEESDFPIGLINIIEKGEKGIALTYDMLGNAVVSFRSGGKYTYGILGVGYNHKANGNEITTEAGYGIHIPVCKWFELNNEFKATTIGASSSLPALNVGYLFAPSFRLGKHYNLFGGVSLNYMTAQGKDHIGLFPENRLWIGHTEKRLQQIYIGYQAGLQFIF